MQWANFHFDYTKAVFIRVDFKHFNVLIAELSVNKYKISMTAVFLLSIV